MRSPAPSRLLPLIALCILGTSLTGCSLLYSRARQVNRYIKIFGAAVGDRRWDEAAKLMTSDFSYINEQNETYGPNSAKAFFKSVDDLKATSFYIFIKDTKEITPTKLVVNAKFQSRQADATQTTNNFWDVSMIWVFVNKQWFLSEIHDLSPKKQDRS